MVPLTQASVCRSATNAGAVLGLTAADRLLNVLPLFHAHGLISGLLTALAAGSSVICTPGFDPQTFYRCLRELRPSWYTAVPTVHRALLSASDAHAEDLRTCSLRVVRSASSSLPPAVLQGLEALFGVPVIETYGMTEAASQIAANPIERRKVGSVGRPTGLDIAVMDEDGRQFGAGKRGEIMLRGPTIMTGYCDDAAANDVAFRAGWFRTGDLGYLDADGYLFIVGRTKDIINRGGQKVSPEEVEQVLLRHPDVLEAAAFGMPHPRLGEAVAAAVVLRSGETTREDALRQFAGERLAAYKIPGLIHIVPAIPKGASGKVKRSTLAAHFASLPAGAPAAHTPAPESELEARLAGIWARLFEIDEVGVDQDLFALGADSILVTQFLSRLRAELQVALSFKDVFDAPTVAALARRLQSSPKARNGAAPTWREPRSFDAGAPLSFQQQRIHFLNKLDPTGCHYNVVEAVRLRGTLDSTALEASIAAISVRHDMLRTTISERRGALVQMVRPESARLQSIDIGVSEVADRDALIGREALRIVHRRVDLAHQSPFQAWLLRFDDDDHALVVNIHHVATDGWSQRLFWDELKAHYARNRDLSGAAPAPLPIQYRHFVAWQQAWLRTRAAKEQLGYWHRQLEGLTGLPLRTDHPRPDSWSGRGARQALSLSTELSERLRSLSRAEGVTPFMALLAAFQCLLYRITGHEDVAVGSLIANRNQVQVERLIGMFANTIVLRTDLSGDPSFRELLQRVRNVTLDAYRNQDLPIEEVLRTLPRQRGQDRSSPFQVMFILQNATTTTPELPGISVELIEVDPGIARFDLTLELSERNGSYAGFLEYSTDLFEADTIALMAGHLQTLLDAILANPEQRISRLQMLSSAERRSVLDYATGVQIAFGPRGDLLTCFAEQLARTPDAVAVSGAVGQFSYRELDARSRAITDTLNGAGIGAEAVVALLGERSPNLLAAMLAVHRAGAAFLCLDPTQPAARLAQILGDSGACAMLVSPGGTAVLDQIRAQMPAASRLPMVMLDDGIAIAPGNPGPAAQRDASSLAYVIYTSGSSGAPKGVLIEQRGLTNHLASVIARLDLSNVDVIAQTAPQSFVISVWQCLAGLMVGARVHVCAAEAVSDPGMLVCEIGEQGVTVLQIVPSLLRAILEQGEAELVKRALSGLRVLIATGEPLAADLCRAWFRLFPHIPLVNAYGASECSDDVTLHCMTQAPMPGAVVPIGRPLPNTRVHVLDTQSHLVPIGVVGELCVGGAGVGRGYIDDPRRTDERFIRDPFSSDPSARLYRTGDLGRWRADGTLECLGRIDRQVKIRGYRIELKEIEQALRDHPMVRVAIVEPRRETGGETRLIAHISAAPGSTLTASELRGFVKARLPDFMIPAVFLFLDKVPLNAHGKVDRAALGSQPLDPPVAGETVVPPRHAREKLLCAIWADVLKLRSIGVTDNFFDLGGHSLLAGQVMARVAGAFQVSLPIKVLFAAPTVALFAERIAQAEVTKPVVEALRIPSPEQDDRWLPSMAQAQMIGMERALPGLPQFNLPFAFRLQGQLDVNALQSSLDEVVRRHQALRTGFDLADGEPIAVVMSAEAIAAALSVEDLADGSLEEDARSRNLLLKAARITAQQEAWTPFDVAKAPLLRARLLRLRADDHVLLLTLHHVIVDGWSIGILLEEISKLYASFRSHQVEALAPPALAFSDAARWQRLWCATAEAAAQLDYWRDTLREPVPVFGQGAAAAARPGARTAHEAVQLPANLIKRLEAFSRAENGTLFMSLLTGLSALLLARTGRRDICIATSMANRTQPGTDRVVGPFENTVIIRTRLDPEMSYLDAFGRARSAVLEAHARQELPFNVLAQRLAEDDGIDPASLIQVYFTLQNPLQQPLKLPEVSVRPLGDISREGQPVLPINQTWLSLMLKERPSGITGSLGYKADLFEAGAIAQWIQDFGVLLDAAVLHPHTPLMRLLESRAA
jgi:amino acid adenylation domain-containing protein